MEENALFKLLWMVLIFLVIVNLVLAEEITLNVGESKEISGNTIKLKNLKSDKAVITVNDQSKILELNDKEEISTLKVNLKEIFYISENEGHVRVEVSALYTCGDNKCDSLETQSSCCQDCGCQQGYDCENNECLVHVEHQCNSDSDCNDNNPNTSDRCVGRPRKCQNENISICEEDSDCNDNNNCTTDSCRNNDCFNERIEGCGSEIPEQQTDTDQEEAVEQFQENIQNLEEKELSFWRRIANFFKKIFGSK